MLVTLHVNDGPIPGTPWRYCWLFGSLAFGFLAFGSLALERSWMVARVLTWAGAFVQGAGGHCLQLTAKLQLRPSWAQLHIRRWVFAPTSQQNTRGPTTTKNSSRELTGAQKPRAGTRPRARTP